MALTAKQRRLQREIEEMVSVMGLEYWNIEDYEEDARTAVLGSIKNHLVRGEIVTSYALLDEFLTVLVCNYHFRRTSRKPTFKVLWRSKRFRIFNHQIMDETYLLAKMRIAHAIAEIPRDVRACIERINAVRNDIAHSFFPENRKAHMPARKRLYQGEDIFTLKGVEKFGEDFAVARDYLMQLTVYRRYPSTLKSDKEVPVREVLEHGSMTDFIEAHSLDRVDKISRAGLREYGRAFEALGIQDIFSKEDELKLKAAFALRNEMVHLNVLASGEDLTFRRNAQKLEALYGGTKIHESFTNAVEWLTELALRVDLKATSKFSISMSQDEANALGER